MESLQNVLTTETTIDEYADIALGSEFLPASKTIYGLLERVNLILDTPLDSSNSVLDLLTTVRETNCRTHMNISADDFRNKDDNNVFVSTSKASRIVNLYRLLTESQD